MIAYTNEANHKYQNFNNTFIPSFYPIVEIHISGKNLAKLDLTSQSDPMCVLYTNQNGQYSEQDRTEVIKNNANPNFVKTFKSYYIFEMNQPLRFEIYDVDSNLSSLKKHDFIGYVETDLQYLVSNLGNALTFDIFHDKKSGDRGQLIITCEQTKESNVNLLGELHVEKLQKMKTFAKNNPFFEISKQTEIGHDIIVYRSKTKQKCYRCTFKQFSIPLHALYSNGLDDRITISIFDHRKKKEPKIIGKYTTTIRHFLESVQSKFELPNGHGKFWFEKLEIVHVPTFADYLRSGLQLKMITAIDFTSSNGYPDSKSSRHFFSDDPSQLNQYQQTIMSVGQILAKYDKDQKFPVYGFGAKIKETKKVSYCFPLNFNESNPNVLGLDGILSTYKEAIPKIKFWGPTYLSDIIRMATKHAIENFEASKTYTILLVMTDGLIEDMVATKDAIVEASDKPLSIIIVGVGDEKFDFLDELDGDVKDLKSHHGDVMKRDIVQSVPFNRYKVCNSAKLEAELLAELPLQVHEYSSTHGFIPNIPHTPVC